MIWILDLNELSLFLETTYIMGLDPMYKNCFCKGMATEAKERCILDTDILENGTTEIYNRHYGWDIGTGGLVDTIKEFFTKEELGNYCGLQWNQGFLSIPGFNLFGCLSYLILGSSNSYTILLNNFLNGNNGDFETGLTQTFPLNIITEVYSIFTTSTAYTIPVISGTIPSILPGGGESFSLGLSSSTFNWFWNSTTSQYTSNSTMTGEVDNYSTSTTANYTDYNNEYYTIASGEYGIKIKTTEILNLNNIIIFAYNYYIDNSYIKIWSDTNNYSTPIYSCPVFFLGSNLFTCNNVNMNIELKPERTYYITASGGNFYEGTSDFPTNTYQLDDDFNHIEGNIVIYNSVKNC